MYILTIYRIVDDIEVEYQQASQDERILKAMAVKWAQNYGWETDGEEQSVDQQFEEIISWLAGGGADDPRILLRKADA